MSVCATVAGVATLVASSGFTLSWTHSVERTEWRERWTVTGDALRLVEARVRGSGAGMDPGDGARLEDGWWVWEPALPAVPILALAASGETGGGWTLCDETGDETGDGAGCRELGATADEPTLVAPCPGDGAQVPAGVRSSTGRGPSTGRRPRTGGQLVAVKPPRAVRSQSRVQAVSDDIPYSGE